MQSNKICAKLEAALNNNDTYEALQLFKSLFFRSKDNDQEVCNMYIHGLECFSKSCDNATCLIDLCKAFITYLSRKNAVTKTIVKSIGQSVKLLHDFPAERTEYVLLLLKCFSSNNRANLAKCDWDDSVFDLHLLLGELFREENKCDEAFYNYIRCNDSSKCAEYVFELFTTQGYPSEFDIFVALGVLQLLSLKRADSADLFLKTILKLHNGKNTLAINGDCNEHQLMFNFLDLLIEVCRAHPKSTKNFRILAKGYRNAYCWDSSLDYFVKLVGKNVFNCSDLTGSCENGQSSSGGFLMDVMRNILSDDLAINNCIVTDNTSHLNTTDINETPSTDINGTQ
ncbi:hypothetical protein GJ496_001352 [Pomphorhynchus laevis]|nr:hypothetical protein GJ496_001352 [Pomphorhynchus laevis]